MENRGSFWKTFAKVVGLISLLLGVVIYIVANSPVDTKVHPRPTPREVTEQERVDAKTTLEQWNKNKSGFQGLWSLLGTLEYSWIPDPDIRDALVKAVFARCDAAETLTLCTKAIYTALFLGARPLAFGPLIIRLADMDTEFEGGSNLRKKTGLYMLYPDNEKFYQNRGMLIDMLTVLNIPLSVETEKWLFTQVMNREETTRWAAAVALKNLGSDEGRNVAELFISDNLGKILQTFASDSYRDRLRFCLYLLRARDQSALTRHIALQALNDPDWTVRSCGALLAVASEVSKNVAEEQLLKSFGREKFEYVEDSIAVSLTLLNTPTSSEAVKEYQGFDIRRFNLLKSRWEDPWVKIFGEM